MDAHLLKVNISVMRDRDEVPTIYKKEFESESRHTVIHEARKWIRYTLGLERVEDDINPLELERATAGVDWNIWFFADDITIKMKVTRQ